MNWKEFLLDKRKIITTIIFLILGYIGLAWVGINPFLFLNLAYLALSSTNVILANIIFILWTYFLSIIFIIIYDKIKKQLKWETKVKSVLLFIATFILYMTALFFLIFTILMEFVW